MPNLFSYVRFSAKKQEKGSSVARQEGMRDAWLARHPDYLLAEARLADYGKSAYHGRHLGKGGALGAFVALAKSGKLPAQSVLCIERLDRFSRQEVSTAYRLFCDLVEAGVSVLTLSPEMLIDQSNYNNLEIVLPVIISLVLAHEESQKKGERVKAAAVRRLAMARKGDRSLVNGRLPLWLSHTGKGFCVRPEAARTIKWVYTQALAGVGVANICKALNHDKRAWRSGLWNTTYLREILTGRAVLGELQPARGGDPIKGYYPAVVSEKDWLRLRATRHSSSRRKGRQSDFISLWSGLLWSDDGSVFHTIGKRNKGKRYLRSANARAGLPNACPYSPDYALVENALLLNLIPLLKAAEYSDDNKQQDEAATLRAVVAGIDARLNEIKAALLDASQPLATLAAAAAALEGKRKETQQELERAEAKDALRASKPREAARNLLYEYARTDDTKEKQAMRPRMRQVIASVIERVDLTFTKKGRYLQGQASVKYHGSDKREIVEIQRYAP